MLISSMTGGFDLARKVNRNLAAAAQELGLGDGRRLAAGRDRGAVGGGFLSGAGSGAGYSFARQSRSGPAQLWYTASSNAGAPWK